MRVQVADPKWLKVTFQYNHDLVELVKKIDGRKYEPTERAWKIPFTAWHCKQVTELLKDFEIDPEIIEKAKHKHATSKKKLNPKLYPFQKEGVKFILSAEGRCIIADEMGLGKTPQSLAFVDLLQGNTLIICPSNVLYKWRNEAQFWTNKKSINIIKTGKDPFPAQSQMDIMTYDIASRKHPELKTRDYQTIICDEAHYLKSPKAIRTRVVKDIAKNIPYAVFLSGTPFMNQPSELFTLLNMIDPVGFSNYFDYAKRYCGAERIGGVWVFPKNVVSNPTELANRLTGIMLRRTKGMVGLELPSLTRSYVPVDMENYKKYEQERKRILAEKATGLNQLAKLNLLRQLVGIGKCPPAIELAESILEQDKQVVLFAHHKEVVSLLQKGLSKYQTALITGDTPASERQKISNEFLMDKSKIRVIIMTTAGAEGIDLYGASDIIIVERDWTPAREEQAEARLHRIGQKNPVTAWYLVANDTIDYKFNELIKLKRDTFKQVVRQDEILNTLYDELLKGKKA